MRRHHPRLQHLRRHHAWHGYHPWRSRPRLLRQLFAWLALTILITALTIAFVFRALAPSDRDWPSQVERLRGVVAEQFQEVWDEPGKRAKLGRDLSEAFGIAIRVDASDGRLLEQHGGACTKPDVSLEVRRGGSALGAVHGCLEHSHVHGPIAVLLALFAAALVLWMAAAALAHKLTRPLFSLIEVTREIGQGNLKSRVRLGRHQRSELGILAESVNEMAERIERQLGEQRELLAVVSHEVRSPLARLRVSSEILRDDPGNAQALSAIEREVTEIDALIGKLLASSRLDFGSIERVPLDPVALARTALERRSLAPELLDARVGDVSCTGDPTLIARALDNLLDNAERHGQSVLRLIVRAAEPGEHRDTSRAIVFEVWDPGPGFDQASLPNVFEAFRQTRSRPAPPIPRNGEEGRHVSLGLGLSLVRRIAEAHGGRAWAENLPSGGARVGLSVG